MKLYDSIGPNPRIVRMFMAEKDITMPKQTVDLRGGENRQEAHLKRNPHGQMPTLELDDGKHRRLVRPRRRAAFGEGVGQRSRPTAVIARSTCDEAIQSCCGTMDCFASLALASNRRHCEEQLRRSNPILLRHNGLLRGACHRARIRATRWLAMTWKKPPSSKSPPVHPAIRCARLRGRGNISPVAARPPRFP